MPLTESASDSRRARKTAWNGLTRVTHNLSTSADTAAAIQRTSYKRWRAENQGRSGTLNVDVLTQGRSVITESGDIR
jgi:hypothetical protein